MHKSEITPQLFSEMVSEHFDFLGSEYGYVLQQQDPDYFRAEKNDISLNIFLERGVNPMVTVELRGQTAQQAGHWHSVAVPSIVDGLYPEADTKMETVGRRTDTDKMYANLEKNAALTKKYLSQILAGDLSQWPEVEAYLDEEDRKWRERLFGSSKKAG